MPLVRALRPQQCTLRARRAGQSTSDHGWDLDADGTAAAPADRRAEGAGRARQPVHGPAARGHAQGARAAAPTASSSTPRATPAPMARRRRPSGWPRYARAAEAALAAGLGLNAGHDLNRANLGDFLRAVPGVQEVSIGHALVADALEFGIRRDGAPVPALHPPGAGARRRGRMIYGIGTDIMRHPPHRGHAGAARRALRREGAGRARAGGVPRAQRARAAARHQLPGHALLGQGGLLQGHRPGHAHADDLARLRGGQGAQRQARDPPARRAGRLVRARGACVAHVSVSDESDYAAAFVVVGNPGDRHDDLPCPGRARHRRHRRSSRDDRRRLQAPADRRADPVRPQLGRPAPAGRADRRDQARCGPTC